MVEFYKCYNLFLERFWINLFNCISALMLTILISQKLFKKNFESPKLSLSVVNRCLSNKENM